VQNINHGLSLGISDPLKSIPRWLFLRSALPYVMHCCSAILQNAGNSFTSFEAKMLYTMHWLMLDSASECEVPAQDSVFPLSSVQLFVYLFAPLLRKVTAEHFSGLRLQHGLQIWQPLWENCQPSIPSVSILVKPKIENSEGTTSD